jgi:hypothetical protein
VKEFLNKRKLIIFVILAIFVGFFVFEYFNHLPPRNLVQPGLEDSIIDTGSDNDSRPALNDSDFESVPLADTYLLNEGLGLVLEGIGGRGQARFYPFQILVWHNLVNDVWNGSSILVSYDPLCGSAAVFESERLFKNSGKIYNNSMLFTAEETDLLWRSFDGQTLPETGDNLSAIPSYVMTWQSFKENFPNGYVLSRETGSARDYSHNPYGNYAATPAVWYPLNKYDSSYPAKTIVYSYGSEVFPLDNIKSAKTISGTEVDFVWDEELETVKGYDKNENEVALTTAYWFCWAANH